MLLLVKIWAQYHGYYFRRSTTVKYSCFIVCHFTSWSHDDLKELLMCWMFLLGYVLQNWTFKVLHMLMLYWANMPRDETATVVQYDAIVELVWNMCLCTEKLIFVERRMDFWFIHFLTPRFFIWQMLNVLWCSIMAFVIFVGNWKPLILKSMIFWYLAVCVLPC